MAGSLYESSFTLLMIFFIAISVAKLRFVEPSWTPPPAAAHNAASVDCGCEQTPPPPAAPITCPPPMPPQPPESFPYPVPSSPPPIVYSSPPPPSPGFSPPTIVYSSPPPPSIWPETPCDIPPPPQQRPWNEFDHPLPGFEFASAESLVNSALHIASLVTVIVLLFIG